MHRGHAQVGIDDHRLLTFERKRHCGVVSTEGFPFPGDGTGHEKERRCPSSPNSESVVRMLRKASACWLWAALKTFGILSPTWLQFRDDGENGQLEKTFGLINIPEAAVEHIQADDGSRAQRKAKKKAYADQFQHPSGAGTAAIGSSTTRTGLFSIPMATVVSLKRVFTASYMLRSDSTSRARTL